jgi:hypothetical protein
VGLFSSAALHLAASWEDLVAGCTVLMKLPGNLMTTSRLTQQLQPCQISLHGTVSSLGCCFHPLTVYSDRDTINMCVCVCACVRVRVWPISLHSLSAENIHTNKTQILSLHSGWCTRQARVTHWWMDAPITHASLVLKHISPNISSMSSTGILCGSDVMLTTHWSDFSITSVWNWSYFSLYRQSIISPDKADNMLSLHVSKCSPEWRSGLRHYISVPEASLQTLVRFQAVSQLSVVGSPIGQCTIGPASLGFGRGRPSL